MPRLDTELVLAKIVEIHHKLRYVTTVEEALKVILPALTEAVGFQAGMLKIRDEDGLFRGYSLKPDGSILPSIRGTELGGYIHFMKRAKRISNSYFASHEINVWGDAGPNAGWENVYDIPDWTPGQWHPEDSLLVPVFDQNGDLAGLLWPNQPIDRRIPDREICQIIEVFATQAVAAIEIRRLLERTQMAAITDGLTRLHTHRYFQECLEREVAEAARHEDCVSLIMMDLDRFKRINDRYGHPVGDQVLRQIAEILKSIARETDYVARYGGEEFAEILPRTDTAGAVAQAERICSAMKEAWNTGLPRPTISVGIASFPADVHDKQTLVQYADKALLKAKRLGRDRICVYEKRQKAANE